MLDNLLTSVRGLLRRRMVMSSVSRLLRPYPGRRLIATARQSSPIDMSFNTSGNNISGENRPIVIMHGVLGSKNNWSSLSKALHAKTKRQVISVDARNHGDSPHTDDFSYDLMAADVVHLLNKMKIDQACLIGHSMGGRTMMRVALSYPDRVEKLVVVDISPTRLSASLVIEAYADMLESLTLDENLPLSQGRRLADQMIAEKVPETDIRQFLLSNLTKVDNKFSWKANLQSLKNNMRNIIQFPLANEAYDYPAIFIGGTRSDYLTPDDHEQIRRYFPQAQFEYLNTGHWVHAERPNEFLQLACKFINNEIS